jgi:WXG100 protein secretion system (Wss), protein YukD
MKTVVVTIAGPERRLDLTVPAETPIEQLMPTFMSLGVIDEKPLNGDPVGLAPAGSPPLPPTSTLAECGVMDGALLELQPVRREERPEPEPETVTY